MVSANRNLIFYFFSLNYVAQQTPLNLWKPDFLHQHVPHIRTHRHFSLFSSGQLLRGIFVRRFFVDFEHIFTILRNLSGTRRVGRRTDVTADNYLLAFGDNCWISLLLIRD